MKLFLRLGIFTISLASVALSAFFLRNFIKKMFAPTPLTKTTNTNGDPAASTTATKTDTIIATTIPPTIPPATVPPATVPPATVPPATLPTYSSPDQILIGTTTSTTATISWSIGFYSPPPKYKINLRIGTVSTVYDAVPTSHDGPNVEGQDLTSLAQGTQYYISMAAVNGDGTLSSYSTEYPFNTLFAAPTHLKVGTFDSVSATIQWDMGLTNTTNQNYELVVLNSTTNIVKSTSSVGSSTSSTVSGLTSNNTYVFSVYVVAFGQNFPSSSCSQLLYPSVNNLSATATSTSTIRVTWTQESGITYTLQVLQSGSTVSAPYNNVSSGIVISNLVTKTTYFILVSGTNSAGTGPNASTFTNTL